MLFFFKFTLSVWGYWKKSWSLIFTSTFLPLDSNGLAAHDCIKLTLIQAYITDPNFDIIFLSEDFLNSSIQNNVHKTKNYGYNLITIRLYHPSGSKKGGVCIVYVEHMSVIRSDWHFTLDNCLVTEIVTEIRLQNKKIILTCVYCSLSQSKEDFEIFCTNFDILLGSLSIDSKVDLLDETLLKVFFWIIFQIKELNVTIINLYGWLIA